MADIYKHTEDLLKIIDNSPKLLAKLRRNDQIEILPYIENAITAKSEREILVYVCHLYSLLKQANGNYLQTKVPLFKALNKLRLSNQNLDKHVKRVLTSYNLPILEHNMETLIRIYKQNTKNGFDFAQLAADLYYMQFSNQKLHAQCLSWGLQYFEVNN